MSLRWRIALSLAAITAVVVSLASAGAYAATASRLGGSLDDSLAASVAAAQGLPGRDRRPDNESSTSGCPLPGLLQPVSAAQLVAADGTTTTCIEGGVTIPVSDAAAAVARDGSGRVFETVTVDGSRLRVLTVARPGGGALQVARDLNEVDSVLASLRVWFVVLAAGGVVAAAIAGWLVARRIVRPIDELRGAAEHIATSDDLSTPIPSGGSGEVGSLAASMATMVGSLADSRARQQRLVDDASHEMRTPLTSLRTNVEVAARLDELDPADRAAVLEAIGTDVDELTNLLAELVELASDRPSHEPLERVELGQLVRDVARRAGRRASRQVTVAGADDGAVVEARPSELERAVANLVDNAAKYSPDGTPIEVEVRGGRVAVRDHGAGIDPADRPYVFERFYRATSARTEPGSGLGLAIVAAVVERHGGTTFVQEASGGDGGAVVGFELPVAPAL